MDQRIIVGAGGLFLGVALGFAGGWLARAPATGALSEEAACTFTLDGKRSICLRKTMPVDEEQFYVGHELAHALIGRPHGSGAEIESICDRLAAVLVAPRAAVLALHREHGWDVAGIAYDVVATQTWAALRLAEVVQQPLATVGPRVRCRGPTNCA